LKNSLSANDTFYKKLSRVIKKVAENEGLSMVLSLQGEESILWYSPAVDITDKVIAELEK
jgi:outer membrane protein